ncbi:MULTISPECIES: response regulator transcription factor [Sphingobacterium]|uniref:Response regulator transcription factor n=1 Tax=Sphingobacterium populi TaxID=1812824 RepID=A0ABW5U910_9SPHI|nr:helix-turn-helix transcriptional regulator [Sphingobacterium sp. CFCC 11742]
MINLTNIQQAIPPGLEDKGVEFYVHNNDIKCLHDGKVYNWGEFPTWILERVLQDMQEHPEVIKALLEWDLTQEEEMLRQYIICRFGGFDNDPDIDSDGVIDYTEYFDCGRRGNCAQEGKLCATIKVENGHLTKQELLVLKLVAEGLPNKLIADRLFISEETVSSHNQNIQQKLGVNSKAMMTAFAIRKNIYEPK